MTIFNVISLFGGLALFLYGMRMMGNGLNQGSSSALKSFMSKVTNNPLVGFFLGLLVTGVIQSSTATIVIVSGLVGAGIMTLHQSIGVILGANVGTTVTGQIIRLLDVDASGASWLNFFKPSTLAPLAAILGILLILVLRFRNSELFGEIAMGFGILFTGLLTMTAAIDPLSESEWFINLFVNFSDVPILGFLVGTGAAFITQSSSATIGILQALSITGALTFSSVYAIIIGVNIGDCVTTAIVCSIGSKADAKRTGMIHILFNICASILIIVGVMVFHALGLLDSFWSTPITSGGIANAHTIFRLVSAIVLLPLCGVFERLSRIIIKDDKQVGESVAHEIAQLDEKFFASPALALSSAKAALSKMAQLSSRSVRRALDLLENYDKNMVGTIMHDEKRIDELADSVDSYLIALSPHVPSGNGNNELNYYIQCLSEFERIGDYAVNLAEKATEIHNHRSANFSDTAREELKLLRAAVEEILGYATVAFNDFDMNTARHIEPIEEVMDDLVDTLRSRHIRRLREGTCTVYAGLTFLEILVNIERIADQCSNIGIYTLAQSDTNVMKNHHDYIKWVHQGGDSLFNSEYQTAHEKYFGELQSIYTVPQAADAGQPEAAK